MRESTFFYLGMTISQRERGLVFAERDDAWSSASTMRWIRDGYYVGPGDPFDVLTVGEFARLLKVQNSLDAHAAVRIKCRDLCISARAPARCLIPLFPCDLHFWVNLSPWLPLPHGWSRGQFGH